MSDEINRLRDRVKDLEDRLHERDLAVATLSQQLSERDAAYEMAMRYCLNRRVDWESYTERACEVSDEAAARTQATYFKAREGAFPESITSGTDWSDLLDNGYFPRPPRNSLRDNATGVMAGNGGPGAASGAALSQQLADRDAAWERAIQSLAEQGVITIDDPVAAVRERMEAEGGGA